MENLNAEQVKNKLEQLALEPCMTGVTIKGYSVVHLLWDALALINSQEQRIKELSEENVYGLSAKELAEKCENLSIELEAMRGAANSYKMHNKKLTEENERLHASCTELTQCCTKLETLYKIESKRVDTVKADTVRKMQERLKEHLEKPEFPWDSFTVAEEVIDQIAKEMLEGVE